MARPTVVVFWGMSLDGQIVSWEGEVQDLAEVDRVMEESFYELRGEAVVDALVRSEVTRIGVRGGEAVVRELAEQDLIDEMCVVIRKILGGEARTVLGSETGFLSESREYELLAYDDQGDRVLARYGRRERIPPCAG